MATRPAPATLTSPYLPGSRVHYVITGPMTTNASASPPAAPPSYAYSAYIPVEHGLSLPVPLTDDLLCRTWDLLLRVVRGYDWSTAEIDDLDDELRALLGDRVPLSERRT